MEIPLLQLDEPSIKRELKMWVEEYTEGDQDISQITSRLFQSYSQFTRTRAKIEKDH